MNHCLPRVVLSIFFCFTIAIGRVQATPDSARIPSSLQQQLTRLRQQDDLQAWIYARLSYADQHAATAIDFLMHTQQEVWRSYKTYEERLAWFDLLSLQGYYQLQTGNILASVNAYETALAFYESYPLPDADIIETVLKPLGNNYTRLADYTTALFIHRKTMTLALQKKDAHVVASTYSNMAICARSQGDLLAARQYCNEGIKRASSQTALFGLLLSTQADILAASNQYDAAATLSRRALQILQQHKNDNAATYWHITALQIAANIALQQQQYAPANSYARQALQLLQQHFPQSRQREKAKTYVLLGAIGSKTTHQGESLSYYQQALLILLPSWKPGHINETPPSSLLYSENTLADALYGKATALQQLQQPEVSLQHYTTAFIAEAKLRKVFFYAASKLTALAQSRSRVEAAVQLAYRLFTSTHNPTFAHQLLLITEMSRAQVLQDERQRRQEAPFSTDSTLKRAAQLQQAIIYYQHELINAADKKSLTALLQQSEYELSLLNKNRKQSSPAEATLTLQNVLAYIQQLPPQVTCLEFFAGTNNSYIIELTNKGIQSIRPIDSSTALHNAIPTFMHHWFASGPSAMTNDPHTFFNECYTVYQGIFNNYLWKKAQQYVLLPDGVFNYLPFDALITRPVYQNNFGSWPYLFKQATLSQAYSLATWHEQQSAHYSSQAFTGFFVAKGQHAQQAALSIEEEYQALRKKISGQYYTNATATWQAFNDITSTTGILHISTHAVSLSTDTFPYLQLYDKPYYLFDLRYKHFSPALVVLSACKTADGQLLEGEGLNSISRGFTAAGAGGVISGLWNVNDKAAIELLQLFYDQLPKQPNVPAALHEAQQQWLQLPNQQPMLQLPYYWAGFVYSGHLQTVTVPVQSATPSYYWLLLLLIPVVAAIAYKSRKGLFHSLHK